LKIIASYAVGGVLLIYASASVLAAIRHLPSEVVAYSVLTGVAFIAVTVCPLYYLVAGFILQGQSERKFSTFFHAASVFMSITTLEEGRVIDINDVALQALGYKREEVVGETVHLVHIWEDPAERERLVQVLVEQGSIRNLEIRIRRKSGGVIHGLMSAELIDMEGERWILAIVRDITTRKEAEEEVIKLNAELAAQARELQVANKELEAFNYMVAHDLRTPLNTMSTSCQAVQRFCGEQLPPECREFLQAGYQSTLRMNQLIAALLDFARVSHIEPRREEVKVSEMAKEIAGELRRTEPQREVECVIAEGLTANADPSLLRIVLDNLMGNAWKYTARQEQPMIEFGALNVDGKEVFFVRDNGCGFERDAAKVIFSPFQRLPGAEVAKGFGIGLATVQRIIERHGGRIWAEGEPGKGASFYFTVG
jgi:PAS domain S-box-containing protein